MCANPCCCVHLGTGCTIIGCLGVISGLISIIYSVHDLKYGNPWFYIIDALFYVFASIALLYGIFRNRPRLVLVNLVITGLAIFMGVVFGIIAIASVSSFEPDFQNNCATITWELREENITCDELKAATIGTAASVFFLSSALNVYFWICNFSFWRTL